MTSYKQVKILYKSNILKKKICIPFFMGKRRYQCIFCEKNYSRKYRLKQHVLRQHFIFQKWLRREQKLQEDTMKLQQRLYISLTPYTSADDKIKMLQNLRPQSNTITTFKQNMAQESSQRRTETVKPGGISKEDQGKLVKN